MFLKERKTHISLTEKINISATIVLYNEDVKTLKKTIDSFLQTPLSKKLFLIDNSPTNSLKSVANHPDITYIYNNKNIGFGRANNLVINKIKSKSIYHLVLNPDVFFTPDVIPNLIKELRKNEELAMIAPKVEYPDGKNQFNCRRFPTFFDLIIRRLKIFKKHIKKQEYQNINLSESFFPDAIHGCFMLFKTNDFVRLQGFDERYFLYMEDIDICKKIKESNKKILFFPKEKITHLHRKGSEKKIKLLLYHLSSAIKYFIKWIA